MAAGSNGIYLRVRDINLDTRRDTPNLYKHTDEDIFPKISDHFRKISEDSPKIVLRPHNKIQTFSDNLRILPKNSEDSRKCFDHSKFKYNLRDKLDISEIIVSNFQGEIFKVALNATYTLFFNLRQILHLIMLIKC